MAGTLYFDNNSFGYALQAGRNSGLGDFAALSSYVQIARNAGYGIAVTDVVYGEMQDGPYRAESRAFIDANMVPILDTYAGKLLYEGRISSDQAGDRSLFEVARADVLNGERPLLLAEDRAFAPASQELGRNGISSGCVIRDSYHFEDQANLARSSISLDMLLCST